MRKVTKYWKWDERLNLTSFKLGGDIQELLNEGLITQNSVGKYVGVGGFPWVINNKDGCTQSVFYRETFFSLPIDGDWWNLNLKDLEVEINEILEPATENDGGDKLIIVFRDTWVAIAGITRL